MPEALQSTVSSELSIDHQEKHEPPQRNGWQSTLKHKMTWLALANQSGYQIEINLHQHVNAPLVAFNNSLSLRIDPRSKLATQARLILLVCGSITGLLTGLLGWRLLQFDSGMEPLSWAIIGCLFGAVLAAAALPFFTHRLGAILEGKNAPGHPKILANLTLNIKKIVADQISQEKTRQTDQESKNEIDPLPPTEPKQLAALACRLATHPSETSRQYGLWRSEEQNLLRRAFTALQKDPPSWTACKQAWQQCMSADNLKKSNS